jgi:hypothetical protein
MNLSFEDEMQIHRNVTLRLAGVIESELNPEQLAALDKYEAAYQSFYLSKWGEGGPHGSVLRMETEGETETRLHWEASIKPLQQAEFVSIDETGDE